MQTAILVIDDHPLFRAGIRPVLLGLQGEVRIEEACDVDDALARLDGESAFDLILYDWNLPGGGGVRGLVVLCEMAPDTPVVVVSGDEDEAVRIAALQVGASAFVAKTADSDAMRAVLLPLVRVRHATAAHSRLADGTAHPRARRPAIVLAPRRREVLLLLALGYTNKRIARQLQIAPATVSAHVSEIFKALQASNRTEAVFNATRLGLLIRDRVPH